MCPNLTENLQSTNKGNPHHLSISAEMKRVLRTDKTCSNCSMIVEYRYCPNCGQENVEVKESFGQLVLHFFYDFTHYDSKIIITLKDLLFKPGILTKEYLSGKRSTYLHPIRLYLFTSFLFFLVSLTLTNTDQRVDGAIAHKASIDTKNEMINSLKLLAPSSKTLSLNSKIKDSLITAIIANIHKGIDDDKIRDFVVVGNITYKRLFEYNALQKSLPADKRETGLISWLYLRWLNSIDTYGTGVIVRVGARTQHLMPKMMFVLLPIFALLLKLFYNKKKYLYFDQTIFSLHFHSAVFFLFLVSAILSLLFSRLAPYIEVFEIILAVIYLFLALRSVYQQSFALTLFKTISLTLIYAIFILLSYSIVILSILL